MAQGLAGIDKNNLDPTVKPGNDFYRYAAGGWLKSHPLDAEHTSNGSFTDLSEACQKQIQELMLLRKRPPRALSARRSVRSTN